MWLFKIQGIYKLPDILILEETFTQIPLMRCFVIYGVFPTFYSDNFW